MQPVLFGLGHGIAEAMIILVPAFMIAPLSQLWLAILERALAIVLHVTLTIVVWNGFQRQRRVLYLLAAIAIHGVVDSLIPILMPLADAVLLIEGALAAIDVLLIVYAIRSTKYYIPRRIQNEEVKV